jgi:DNA-binding MarR family transcriptional regulator
MSSPTSDRSRLLAQYREQTQLLATATVLFQQAVADRLKLNILHIHCASLLQLMGPMTAGQLAELTGLTTGAVTAMIDRLEGAGYVRREIDPADRRRVLVHAVGEALERDIGALYEPLAQAQAALHAQYSDQDLALLVNFMARTSAQLLDETRKLHRTAAPQEATPGYELSAERVAVPLGSAQAGHLVVATDATSFRISGDPAQADLFRAAFHKRIPTVFVRDGLVKVIYRRSRLKLGAGAAELTLSGRVPWRLDLVCSAASCTIDLRAVPLRAIALDGAGSEIRLTLPPPTAIVPIRIAGAASDVVIRRPANTPLRVRLRHGAFSPMVSSLTIDGRDLTAARSKLYQTGDYAEAAQRYEVDIAARTSSITIESEA